MKFFTFPYVSQKLSQTKDDYNITAINFSSIITQILDLESRPPGGGEINPEFGEIVFTKLIGKVSETMKIHLVEWYLTFCKVGSLATHFKPCLAIKFADFTLRRHFRGILNHFTIIEVTISNFSQINRFNKKVDATSCPRKLVPLPTKS